MLESIKHIASITREISSIMGIEEATIYTKSRADLFEIPDNNRQTMHQDLVANDTVDGMNIL